MILKQLELVNFQTIKNFSQTLEGNVYFITGDNQLGKSTLLKAIAILLTGNRDEVLKTGEKKGFAKAIIGNSGNEYEVELRFTEANPRGTLTIKDSQSGLKSDRISTLQDIFGYTNFDANEFILWSATAEGRRKQVEAVKALLPKATQTRIAEIDKEVDQTKEARKENNSELKVYTNLVTAKQKGISKEDLEKYKEPLDTEKLFNKKTIAAARNEQIKGVVQRYEERKKDFEAIPGKIESIKEETRKTKSEYDNEEKELREEFARRLNAIEAKRVKLDEQEKEELADIDKTGSELSEKIKNAEAYLKKNKPVEMDELQKQIDSATEHNEKYKKVQEISDAIKKASIIQEKIDKQNESLTKLSEEREKLITESKLPVDGLSFTEDGLTLNSIPFESGHVSDSEIMEVVARLIMAKNPKVKVFRIGRGESLGAKRLKAIIEFAKANGYQGFIEQVVRGQNELIVEEYTEK